MNYFRKSCMSGSVLILSFWFILELDTDFIGRSLIALRPILLPLLKVLSTNHAYHSVHADPAPLRFGDDVLYRKISRVVQRQFTFSYSFSIA